MLRIRPVLVTLLLSSSASHANNNCDAIRAQIEAKVRSSGVTEFSLSIVEAQARVSGKVVGSCDLGTKQIIYNQGSPAAPAQPKPKASERILTECKDGSVSVGGDCKK